MKRMSLLYLFWSFLGLFMENHAYKNGIIYRKNVNYQNMLPEHADVNLIGFSGVSLAECSLKCFMRRGKCLGYFHNKDTRSCKLLYDKLQLVNGLVFQTQIGWNFYSDNRKYPFRQYCYSFKQNLLC